jgi:hypothetical protein
MALFEHTNSTYWYEIIVWSIPALLGLWLCLRGRRKERAGWLLVGLSTAGFALDKGVDLHAVLHGLGQTLVHRLDPETHFRDENLILRGFLLGSIFLVGMAGGAWLLRRDQEHTPGKLIALSGVVLVMAYLGLRLMPGVGDYLERTFAGWLVEATAWTLVIGGELAGLRATRGVSRQGQFQ